MSVAQKPALKLGSFSKRSGGCDWMPPRQEFTAPTRVTNAGSTALYVPDDRTVYRPGSVDANRPRVRGM